MLVGPALALSRVFYKYAVSFGRTHSEITDVPFGKTSTKWWPVVAWSAPGIRPLFASEPT